MHQWGPSYQAAVHWRLAAPHPAGPVAQYERSTESTFGRAWGAVHSRSWNSESKLCVAGCQASSEDFLFNFRECHSYKKHRLGNCWSETVSMIVFCETFWHDKWLQTCSFFISPSAPVDSQSLQISFSEYFLGVGTSLVESSLAVTLVTYLTHCSLTSSESKRATWLLSACTRPCTCVLKPSHCDR